MSGSVTVVRGQQPPISGTLLLSLREGDVVRVAAGGSAEVVLFANGARFQLAAGSAAQVASASLKARTGPAPLARASLSPAFLRSVTTTAPGSGRILGVLERGGEGGVLGPHTPSPSAAVRATPVVLRWRGHSDAEKLHLQINEGEEKVHSAELPPSAKEYPVPEGTLRPGRTYLWSVTAVRGGDSGPSCAARLRLLTSEERAAVAQIEQEAATAGDADPALRLLLAQAYERLGLQSDARAAYEEVQRLYPQDAGIRAALQRLGGPQ